MYIHKRRPPSASMVRCLPRNGCAHLLPQSPSESRYVIGGGRKGEEGRGPEMRMGEKALMRMQRNASIFSDWEKSLSRRGETRKIWGTGEGSERPDECCRYWSGTKREKNTRRRVSRAMQKDLAAMSLETLEGNGEMVFYGLLRWIALLFKWGLLMKWLRSSPLRTAFSGR